MIIAEPLGGLANRMRVIASAILLQQKLNTKLIVIWNENYELNCPFNLLFEDCPAFTIQSKERKYNYIKSSNQTTPGKKIQAAFVNKLIGIDYCILDNDFYNLVFKGKLDVYFAAKNHGITYIQTCQAFGETLNALSYFKPVLSVREKIRDVARQITACTIGVHIRRTDHDNSIKYSPIDLFVQKMQAAMAACKKTTFFLCTDDPEVEKIVTSFFCEKVIVHKKERSRQTVRGMQDAVVDLYCLSATSKILGSYWSSFAEIAAALNNIELEIVRIPE
ncbi:hypothetical protein [Mucilaginibacter flavidus]|uniref:hypothetical protein n=1 Tax=Mucilaginibacter flavidus TaxID=2949309 RepID=UPI0020922CAD|nr:hypothetical protein [Mucilaginibacter flavidus]MCO5947678.1 hypothetical protein [Mucilaginibacter flavidus]